MAVARERVEGWEAARAAALVVAGRGGEGGRVLGGGDGGANEGGDGVEGGTGGWGLGVPA